MFVGPFGPKPAMVSAFFDMFIHTIGRKCSCGIRNTQVDIGIILFKTNSPHNNLKIFCFSKKCKF